MIVARQFIAWDRPIENPSRRARSDSYPGCINRPDLSTPVGPNHTVPSGTGPSFEPVPGNKLPGYLHSAPSGREPKTTHGTGWHLTEYGEFRYAQRMGRGFDVARLRCFYPSSPRGSLHSALPPLGVIFRCFLTQPLNPKRRPFSRLKKGYFGQVCSERPP